MVDGIIVYKLFLSGVDDTVSSSSLSQSSFPKIPWSELLGSPEGVEAYVGEP